MGVGCRKWLTTNSTGSREKIGRDAPILIIRSADNYDFSCKFL